MNMTACPDCDTNALAGAGPCAEHRPPHDAPQLPNGHAWKHAELLEVGDEIFAGAHSLFSGKREDFWLRVISLDPKPKTIYAVVSPTDSRLMGQERRRFRRDEWLEVHA